MGAGHGHALYVHEHSILHRLPPEAKVLAAFLFVVFVAITPRRDVWAFAIYGAIAIGVIALGRIPIRFVLARLVAILPFVIFALFLPFIGHGERIDVAGVGMSIEGLWAMWNILAKAGLGATISIMLAATTETTDIIKGFGRLRVPAVITAIASFMIRYLEVIAGELGRMRVAMTARGYDPRWLWQVRPIASSAGALFVRSYERGERVYDAMLARGYTGVMPTLATAQAGPRDWVVAMSAPLVAAVVAIAALLT